MEKIKATRMEYLKLKKRLKTASRGYKLLKEKRDGLMRKFMEIIKETKSKREELEEKMGQAGKDFAIATAPLLSQEIEEFFTLPASKIEIEAKKENVMSVWIPKFTYKITGSFQSYSDLSAPKNMGKALDKFWQALEVMIFLAGIEHSARLLSFEIEKTRRRVNALEYVIIPQIEKNIKFIAAKLDEQERAEKIIRLKIKDMITA